MSAASSTPVTPQSRQEPMRLLLFGLPGSGKSALLGALSQAAQTQQGLLGGQLHEPASNLKSLRSQVYDGTPRSASEDLVSYSVSFQSQDEDQPTPAEFIDCSGKAVRDLLDQADKDDAPETPLDHAVDQADGLIVVVDASAKPDQLDRSFEGFGRFLNQLEEDRGERIEASGLPVFIVLTKCDLLAGPNDSTMDWMERIEQRKREVDARFRAFLSRRDAGEGHSPFGQVDLYLWATAVKRPALARSPARPREPFGVAELFRQSLEKAEAFRDRREQAGRRLFWTAALSSILVAAMFSLTAVLAVFNQERPRSELEVHVERMFASEPPTVADRLRYASGILQQKLDRFKQILADPAFPSLPEDLRTFVQSRAREISDYLDYLDRLSQAPSPADLTSDEQLAELRKRLEKDSDLKPEEDWDQTPAWRLHQSLVKDLDLMQDKIRELREWFSTNGTEARRLASFETGLRGVAWEREARKLLEQTRQIPSTDQPFLPGSQTVTPKMVLAIPEVKRDHDFFARNRQRLEAVRDLFAALGLLGQVPELPPVLVISPSFKLDSAAKLVGELKQAYPRYESEFVLEGLPRALRREVEETARTYAEPLLAPARALVLAKLQGVGGASETPARWAAVRRWLEEPAELLEWRILGRLLARQQSLPEPTDPVVALREFLGKANFPIDVTEFTLEVPRDFRDRVPGNAELVLTNTKQDGERTSLVYRLMDSKPGPEGETWEYQFVRRNSERISYAPGDQLRASIELNGGESLSWANQRSKLYQFERLWLPPRLHRSSQPESEGTVKRGIRLSWAGGDKAVPRVPELMPQVKLE